MTTTTTTVNIWSDGGPYYAPTLECYKISSMGELIASVREAMAESQQYIGIFRDGECIGFWEDDSEPEPDGEGGWYFPHKSYVLNRPGGRGEHFNRILPLLRQAGSKLK